MKNHAVLNWFAAVRRQSGPKFITGLRGTHKTEGLRQIDAKLKKEGVAASRRLWIDTADPRLRRYTACGPMLEYLSSRMPKDGKFFLLIPEAATLPDADMLLGILCANPCAEIIATSSSKRLLERGLGKYLGSSSSHLELLPDTDQPAYDRAEARARWNEIFISDVLQPNIVLETALLNRAVGWLSDHIGDQLSLRIISRAISPTKRELSPHTIERYLTTLEDSHMIEKTQVMDSETGVISKRNYKYFFTDPELRIALFGPAMDDEDRRQSMNRAWLKLRHQTKAIYCTLRDPIVDFITTEGDKFTRWHANPDGVPVEV